VPIVSASIFFWTGSCGAYIVRELKQWIVVLSFAISGQHANKFLSIMKVHISYRLHSTHFCGTDMVAFSLDMFHILIILPILYRHPFWY
jgi:hypothetical protein